MKGVVAAIRRIDGMCWVKKMLPSLKKLMLSSASAGPDGAGVDHVLQTDITRPGSVRSQGNGMDIVWRCYGVCRGAPAH